MHLEALASISAMSAEANLLRQLAGLRWVMYAGRLHAHISRPQTAAVWLELPPAFPQASLLALKSPPQQRRIDLQNKAGPPLRGSSSLVSIGHCMEEMPGARLRQYVVQYVVRIVLDLHTFCAAPSKMP